MPINVMIVDDIPEISSHFSFVLQNEKDMNVVGVASKGSEAVKKAIKLKPDVILMDIQMETDDAGLIATKQILEKLPDTKIIMLTIHDSIQNITEAYIQRKKNKLMLYRLFNFIPRELTGNGKKNKGIFSGLWK